MADEKSEMKASLTEASIFQSFFRYERGATLSDVLIWGKMIEGRRFSIGTIESCITRLRARNVIEVFDGRFRPSKGARQHFGIIQAPVPKATEMIREYLSGLRVARQRVKKTRPFSASIWEKALSNYNAEMARLNRIVDEETNGHSPA